MTWDQLSKRLVRFPRCGHERTPENSTLTGKCRTCVNAASRRYNERLAAKYGRGQSAAARRMMAEEEIKRLGINGIHGDQFDRARRRTEKRIARDARRQHG